MGILREQENIGFLSNCSLLDTPRMQRTTAMLPSPFEYSTPSSSTFRQHRNEDSVNLRSGFSPRMGAAVSVLDKRESLFIPTLPTEGFPIPSTSLQPRRWS